MIHHIKQMRGYIKEVLLTDKDRLLWKHTADQIISLDTEEEEDEQLTDRKLKFDKVLHAGDHHNEEIVEIAELGMSMKGNHTARFDLNPI